MAHFHRWVCGRRRCPGDDRAVCEHHGGWPVVGVFSEAALNEGAAGLDHFFEGFVVHGVKVEGRLCRCHFARSDCRPRSGCRSLSGTPESGAGHLGFTVRTRVNQLRMRRLAVCRIQGRAQMDASRYPIATTYLPWPSPEARASCTAATDDRSGTVLSSGAKTPSWSS